MHNWNTHYHSLTGISETTYPNGLKLFTLERHNLPIVTAMIFYKVGGRYAEPGKTGLAHFIEHLMFKGTANLSTGEIDQITEKVGGTNNAFTGEDYTCYYFDVPADSWKRALEIEADRMVNCQWDSGEFNNERNVVLEEIGFTLDSPWELLTEEAETLCYARHPYRYPILGWKEDIAAVTQETVYNYYRQYYAPNNAILVLTGDIHTQEVADTVATLFGSLPSVTLPVRTVSHEVVGHGQKRVTLYQEVELPRFIYLFPTCPAGTWDDYVLDLLDIVLSGGRNSRLFRRFILRENLVQNIATANETREHPGIFSIAGSLAPQVPPTLIEELIVQEVEQIAAKAVGPYELARAKNLFFSQMVFGAENNYGIAEKIGEAEIYGGIANLAKIRETMASIQLADLKAIVQKYLNIERATIAWSLPKKIDLARYRRRPVHKVAPLKFLPQDKKITPIVPSNFFALPAKTNPILRADGSMDVCRTILDNGLTVLILKNPTTPAISIDLYSRIAINDAGKEGTGNLLGRLLLEGTKRRSADLLSHMVELMGAGVSGSSSGVAARLQSQDLPVIMDILSEIVTQPALEPAAIQREKRKVVANLLTSLDHPYYRASMAFRRLIYGKHPFSHPAEGSLDSLKRITRQDLNSYWQRRFVPNRSVLAICGDLDPEAAMTIVERAFAGWKKNDVAPPSFPELKLSAKPVTKYVHMPAKNQLVVYWGHLGVRRNDPAYAKLLVLEHIMGQGAGLTDRLSKKIRDELGLCYTVSFSITGHAGTEPGMILATLSTSQANYHKAIGVLLAEIDKIRAKGITKAELADAQEYLTRSIVFNLEDNDSLVGLILKMEQFNLGFDYIGRLTQQIRSLTREDIRAAARDYLHPEYAATVVVGAVSPESL